jgi:hypothetical protein
MIGHCGNGRLRPGRTGLRKRRQPLAVLAILLVTAGVVLGHGQPAHDGLPSSRQGPWFGVLQVTAATADRLSGTGLTRAVISLDWSQYQPTSGHTNTAYVTRAAALVARLRAEGVGAVLDAGLQHPPDWVFGLPGATRFRNQYGVPWTGSGADGTAVANAVFDSSVRAAEGAYLRRIATDLGGGTFAAIRVGGLLTGELRYPPADDGAGHHDSIWFFDSGSRALAPVTGWQPGKGSRTDIARSVHAYLSALTGYERWLLTTTAAAFPSGQLQILFPGWGLRPGQVEDAIDDGLDGGSRAERGGMLSSGLAWDGQVRALAAYKTRAMAYTTWLDAASGGTTPQLVSPVQYLAALAATAGVQLAGENTGQQATTQSPEAALRVCIQRVRTLRLAGMMWMSEPDLLAGQGGLTLSDYAGAYRSTYPRST